MTEKKKNSFWSNGLLLFLSLVLLLGGGWFIYEGFNQEPEHTPDVAAPVYSDPSQSPVGPEAAEVEVPAEAPDKQEVAPGEAPKKKQEKVKVQMTPEAMKENSLFLPAIAAYALIDTEAGKVEKNELTLPEAEKVTRWQQGADLKSKEGNILIAGHVNLGDTRGALYNTANLKPGNIAYLKDADGKVGKFQLESLVPIKKTALPKSIWSTKGPKKLVIVTCGGELHQQENGTWHFDSNIVATFKPVNK